MVAAIHEPTSEIVFQRNGKILVTPGPLRPQIAADVRLCAELESIVAGSYLFRLSPVTIWGSAARQISANQIIERLDSRAAAPIPAPIAGRIAELHGRYGRVWLEHGACGETRIHCRDHAILQEIGLDDRTELPDDAVAHARRALVENGWPVVDRRHIMAGESFPIAIESDIALRPYQQEAVRAHQAAGEGVVLLPCGAGKTVVGVAVMCAASASTLIFVPSREIARQWFNAIVAHTTVDSSDIAVSSTDTVKPVTIATYQAASRGRIGPVLGSARWGLVIFDEVQSLPAEVFRTVAGIATQRRLGLSATLVREDGREAEVFAMVGPVVFDLPWIELEHEGWIAPARCYEVRIPEASNANDRERYKLAVVERLLAANNGRQTLVVGTAIELLSTAATRFGLALLTGRDDQRRRNAILEEFRSGKITQLAISRIGSVGLDLPNTQVMIQLNGNFGSRQEEAQRLGRLLRPNNGETVHFFTLVSEGTREVAYAGRRQRFLVDQGYEYEILNAADIPRVEQ